MAKHRQPDKCREQGSLHRSSSMLQNKESPEVWAEPQFIPGRGYWDVYSQALDPEILGKALHPPQSDG